MCIHSTLCPLPVSFVFAQKQCHDSSIVFSFNMSVMLAHFFTWVHIVCLHPSLLLFAWRLHCRCCYQFRHGGCPPSAGRGKVPLLVVKREEHDGRHKTFIVFLSRVNKISYLLLIPSYKYAHILFNINGFFYHSDFIELTICFVLYCFWCIFMKMNSSWLILYCLSSKIQ